MVKKFRRPLNSLEIAYMFVRRRRRRRRRRRSWR
jgi:hypothetical protein